jgi:hypothetical protein
MVLEEEIHFFYDNQKRLERWYPYSFIVIKGQRVYGGFPSIWEAYISALEKFEIGTFLVIKTIRQVHHVQGRKLPVKLAFPIQFYSNLYHSVLS